LYGEDGFKNIVLDDKVDPELAIFINDTKMRGPKFANYSPEKIEYFVNGIYELRKDNTNNTAG
jgi:hypothetical protein